MAVVLGGLEEKHFDISEVGTDDVCRLFYREPTTKELNTYTNKQFVRKGKKLENQTGQLRIKYGGDICTGFRKGDYVLPDGKGGVKVISSDKDDPDYHPNWKGLLKQFAPKHLHLLAAHVFEQSAETGGMDEDAILEDDDFLEDYEVICSGKDDPEKNSPPTSNP